MNFNNLSGYLFAAWLMIAVLLFIPPTNPPGAAPVRVADVSPTHYATPAPLGCVPLSAHFREPLVATIDPDQYDPLPLSYDERFSMASIGPDQAWAEWALNGCPGNGCPISRAAVHEQGIGE